MTIKTPSWLPAPVLDRLTIYDTREAWLDARNKRIADGVIGSTTAAALIALSPWRNPWDCWAAVHAPHLIEQTTSDPRLLARGLALEGLADRLYREETGSETWGVDAHMAVMSADLLFCVSPDAFCRHPSAGVGVAEYKIVQPWRRDKYPSEYIEIRSLADLDAASTLGRWPVDRQYVIQCLVHLMATGADYVDLFAVFAKDVQLGHNVDGWDSPIAVEGTARMRIWRDADLLIDVATPIIDAHFDIIKNGKEPVTFAPPPPWDTTRDPLDGKRDATAEEVVMLGDLAEKSNRAKLDKADISMLRARLRDCIADSGNKGISAESDSGTKVTASVSKSGRLTVRGL